MCPGMVKKRDPPSLTGPVWESGLQPLSLRTEQPCLNFASEKAPIDCSPMRV